MPAWLAPAGISAGTSLLSKIAGAGKQKSYYEMSPEEREIYDLIMGQIEGDVPSSVTAPFVRARKGIEQHYARQPGASGLKWANIQKFTTAPQAEAVGQYKQGLLNIIANFMRGKGTQVTEAGAGWGDIIGGVGGDIGLLMGLEKILGAGGGTTGGAGQTFLSPSARFSLGR